MRGKFQFFGMAAFLVLVLAGIGFFLSQEQAELPGTVAPSPDLVTAELPVDSGTPTNTLTANVQPDPEIPETSPEAEEEELPADDSAKDDPATKVKRPRGPGTIKGTVTWHGDGAPVSGADIHLDFVDRPNRYDPYPEERMTWTAHTDAKGAFRISNLPVNKVGRMSGQLTVTASKDGASAVSSVGLTDDETQTLVDLVLRPSGGIGGQVVDDAGTPVKGAIVVPLEMTDKAEEQYSYGARNLWTASATDGRFQLDHLNEGSWKLAVHAEHFAAAITSAFNTGESNAKVVLARGTSVSGKVINAASGEPVEGVFITVNAQDDTGNQRRAGTDKEGEFVVEALANGAYQVFLDDETRVLIGEAPKFSIAKAEPVEGIVLTVADGGSISGMVTDVETGDPIAGVRISAQGNSSGTSRALQGFSDETGLYKITGVPGGSYTLRRRWKAGYRHGETRENKAVTLALGEVLENIDFAVPRGLTLSGVVVDEAGDPVEGINVNCMPVVDNGEGEDVRTTEDGAFAVRGFSPNVDVNIQVAGRGYSAPQVGPLSTGESGMTDLKIVVAAGASVSGIVVDTAGKPMAEMYVSASSTSGASGGGSESTGPSGKFQIKSLAEGTYRLEARRQNSWSSRQQTGQEITVAQGEKVTDIRLVFDGTTGVTISGRITNEKREPLKDVSVQAYSPAGGSNAYIQSDTEGNYELSVEEGLTYTMTVHHPNYTQQQREGVAAGERNVDFTLEWRGTVEGQVLDAATGKPIPNFEIAHFRGAAALYNYQGFNYTSFFNEEGRFTLGDVEAGETTLFVRATGYGPMAQMIGEVRSGEVTGDIQFRLKAGASIEGVVVDTAGAPVPSAQIYLLGQVESWMINQNFGGGNGPAATTDADGHFVVSSLGEDLTKITAVHANHPNTTVDVALTPGATIQVEIVMSGGGTVEGNVSINGTPAANQQVYAHDSTGGSQNATTDENGFYSMAKLAPGDVNVSANITRDGVTRSMNKLTIVEGGATTTLDLDIALGTGVIQGRIFVGGQPATEGFVGAVLSGGEESGQQHLQGTVSSDGTYLIEGLSPGEYRIMVHAAVPGSSQRRMRNVDATLEVGQTLTLDIDLDDGAHVRGNISGVAAANQCQVLAISGAFQIADLETDLRSPDLQARIGGYSAVDASGNYELTGLQAGDYTIVAFQMGPNGLEGATFASGPITVSDSGTVDLDLALR